MAGRLPDMRRIRVVTARRGEFGDQGWRAREFGDQGWRPREFGDQGWRAREFGDQGWRLRENGDFAGKARVPCAKADNGTPPDFGLSRELWTGRGSATSRQWSGTQACHKHHGNQRDCSCGSIHWKRSDIEKTTGAARLRKYFGLSSKSKWIMVRLQ